jgi:hypothetical protein
MAETRPSHRIKINDSYREMHALATGPQATFAEIVDYRSIQFLSVKIKEGYAVHNFWNLLMDGPSNSRVLLGRNLRKITHNPSIACTIDRLDLRQNRIAV